MNWSSSADALVRVTRRYEPIELGPRNPLQEIVENAILVPHGVAPLSCPVNVANVRTRLESTPCTQSSKSKPDSSGLDPGIHPKGMHWPQGGLPGQARQ